MGWRERAASEAAAKPVPDHIKKDFESIKSSLQGIEQLEVQKQKMGYRKWPIFKNKDNGSNVSSPLRIFNDFTGLGLDPNGTIQSLTLDKNML